MSVAFIRDYLEQRNRSGPLEILEFGCGAGYQVDPLERLGRVTASDLVVDPDYPQTDFQGRFHVCDIAQAPYRSHAFDVIYSNHVLEHVEDIGGTLRELCRLLRPGGVIAVGLPTPMWLLLSIPTQIADKLINVTHRLIPQRFRDRKQLHLAAAPGVLGTAPSSSGLTKKLALYGHGQYGGFFECLSELRAKAWRIRFHRYGLRVVREEPLLAYATVRWPIIPANRWMVHWGVVSSRLYLLRPEQTFPDAVPE